MTYNPNYTSTHAEEPATNFRSARAHHSQLSLARSGAEVLRTIPPSADAVRPVGTPAWGFSHFVKRDITRRIQNRTRDLLNGKPVNTSFRSLPRTA